MAIAAGDLFSGVGRSFHQAQCCPVLRGPARFKAVGATLGNRLLVRTLSRKRCGLATQRGQVPCRNAVSLGWSDSQPMATILCKALALQA